MKDATPVKDLCCNDRHSRQYQIQTWCKQAFGYDHATNVEQRGVRFREEAIELAQSVGVTREMALALVDFIFKRDPGAVPQEVGGVSVTLLCLCDAFGIQAEDAERAEINRVLSLPIEHFTARNKAKNDAGFNVVKP